jgi:hypothetical protein
MWTVNRVIQIPRRYPAPTIFTQFHKRKIHRAKQISRESGQRVIEALAKNLTEFSRSAQRRSGPHGIFPTD